MQTLCFRPTESSKLCLRRELATTGFIFRGITIWFTFMISFIHEETDVNYKQLGV